MKFLVTGATGFIGARVVANLQARGIPTVATDLNLNGKIIESLEKERTTNVKPDYLTMDVSAEEEIAHIFAQHPDISHCIHLAYLMSAEVEANQKRGAEVNIVGMANMFDAAARHKLHRLVFASSETVYGAHQSVYGDSNHAITEDEYCGLQHHHFTYGVMKLLNEFVAGKYIQKHGISIACLRPAVVFGHGRVRGSVLWAGNFASYPAIGKAITLPFPAETTDCWIYKDDAAEQFVRLTLKDKIAHLAYNNGGESVTAAQLADKVRHWLPDADISFTPDAPGTALVDNTDGSRLADEIEFIPAPILNGIRSHINEARKEANLPPV